MRDGTYRGHRHENRFENQHVSGIPERPPIFGPAGRKLWNVVFKVLPESCFTEMDYAALTKACLLEDKCAQLRKMETSKDIYHFLALVKEQRSIMKEFGWTPGDRARVKAPPKPEKSDEDKFFTVKTAS